MSRFQEEGSWRLLKIKEYQCPPMQEMQCFDTFLEHGCDLPLVQLSLHNDVGEIATLQVVHHHPQVVGIHQIRLDVVDHVLKNYS